MEVPTTEDIKADARRNFRWGAVLPPLLSGVTCFLAIAKLRHPELIGVGRIFWALLPLPFLVWAFLSWGKADKRNSEYERSLNQEANAFAYRLTIFWLLGMILLDAAVGFPIDTWTPFTGVRDPINWSEAVILPPLFFSFIGFMVVRRRVFPRK